jgi:N-acetylmuramoyl-L-alanine amidase
MSASLNNAGLELMPEAPRLDAPPAPSMPPITSPPGREALQALLAFSSLHQQILRRRENGPQELAADPEEVYKVEQLVLDEVLQLVAERALAMTGADGIAIALAEANGIVCRAAVGRIAPDVGARVDPSSGFSGECLVSGSVVRCDDAENDPRVDVVACQRLGVRSMLAVPLSARQSILGFIEAFSVETHGFNDSDVRSLRLLAELILAAMRPEEEDRRAEIARQVVQQAALKTTARLLEEAEVQDRTASAVESLPVEIMAEPVAVEEADEDLQAPIAIEATPERESRPGLLVVFAVVLIAIAVGSGLWWKMRVGIHAAVSKSQPLATAAKTPVDATQTSAVSVAASAVPVSAEQNDAEGDDGAVAPEIPEKPGTQPEVTGVRHWSSADTSTVVVDLQDQVQYEAHRLTSPERIYFDLHDTKLVATLVGKSIDVQDGLVQKIRVAQPVAGVTRVVLETQVASDFSVSLEPNPYRLVVEVRKQGAKPHDRAKIDLFAPNNTLAQQPAVVAATLPPLATPGKATATPALATNLKPVSSSALVIALDAGHGGWDLGTVGRKGLLEKDLVLDIVDRLGKLVEARLGAQVVYTRTQDNYLSLEKRAEIANVARANLFLSVHANYSDFPSARGVETYYSNTYSSVRARTQDTADDEPALKTINWTNVDIRQKVRESHRFAADIQHALYGTLAAKNPGLPNRGVKEAQYVVLTGTSMPAVLAEVSFVSSPTDENNLQSTTYRQQIAEALYRGVAAYTADSGLKKMAKK